MALNDQLNGDDSRWKTSLDGGVLFGAFFVILGDYDSTMSAFQNTSSGSTGGFAEFLVSVYALIAQIMLVNLLIAMMGDTFNRVQENADKEWMYSRYHLVVEYTHASFHPPPFNIFIIPIKKFYHLILWIQAKQRNEEKTQEDPIKFKNIIKYSFEAFLFEQRQASKRTLESVSDHVNQLKDSQKVLHTQITEKIIKMLQHPPQVAPSQSARNPLQSQPSQKSLKQSLVRQPSQGQKLHYSHPQVDAIEITNIKLQNKEIPVTWMSNIIKDELIQKALEFPPFIQSVENLVAHTTIRSIHIQTVVSTTTTITDVKFQANFNCIEKIF